MQEACSGVISIDYENSHSNIVSVDNLTTGTNINETSENFIYPNPAFDRLFINNIPSPNALIKIYDLQGRWILSKQTNSGQIDTLSKFSKGTYIVKLFNLNNQLIDISKLIVE